MLSPIVAHIDLCSAGGIAYLEGLGGVIAISKVIGAIDVVGMNLQLSIMKRGDLKTVSGDDCVVE